MSISSPFEIVRKEKWQFEISVDKLHEHLSRNIESPGLLFTKNRMKIYFGQINDDSFDILENWKLTKFLTTNGERDTTRLKGRIKGNCEFAILEVEAIQSELRVLGVLAGPTIIALGLSSYFFTNVVHIIISFIIALLISYLSLRSMVANNKTSLAKLRSRINELVTKAH